MNPAAVHQMEMNMATSWRSLKIENILLSLLAPHLPFSIYTWLIWLSLEYLNTGESRGRNWVSGSGGIWGQSRPCPAPGRQRRAGWWRSPPGSRAGTWRPACHWQPGTAWRSRPGTSYSGECQTETVSILNFFILFIFHNLWWTLKLWKKTFLISILNTFVFHLPGEWGGSWWCSSPPDHVGRHRGMSAGSRCWWWISHHSATRKCRVYCLVKMHVICMWSIKAEYRQKRNTFPPLVWPLSSSLAHSLAEFRNPESEAAEWGNWTPCSCLNN